MKQFLISNRWWLLGLAVALAIIISPARTWIDITWGDHTILRVATHAN